MTLYKEGGDSMRAADDARAGMYSRNMLRQYSFSDSRTMRRNHHKYH